MCSQGALSLELMWAVQIRSDQLKNLARHIASSDAPQTNQKKKLSPVRMSLYPGHWVASEQMVLPTIEVSPSRSTSSYLRSELYHVHFSRLYKVGTCTCIPHIF